MRQAERLSAEGVVARLDALRAPHADLTVLSGGNPALHHAGPLVSALRASGRRVAVETQGSVWRDWLLDVDRLVVSPKPPSSGMATLRHDRQFMRFLNRLTDVWSGCPERACLKVVVFDERDLQWAVWVHHRYPTFPFYLSAGTEQDLGCQATRDAVAERYRWLCEAVVVRPELARARVLPQLHVIAWGPTRGV